MMNEDEIAKTSDPIVHYQYAHVLQSAGEYGKAIERFEHAISLDPYRIDCEVYAFASWLLATCPNHSLRNGKRAVELATVACDITGWTEGWTIGILAAGLAETGNHSEAILRQEQACGLAFDSNAEMLQQNLKLLKAGRPLPFHCYP